ncbi:MAG: DUF2256 domain-containing protein [Verrucomicrobia bacterium]|nr:DUF2256 domain-containing protein [Verrucomicrobiota bacterium]
MEAIPFVIPIVRSKRDLPVKTCAVCGRPFTWRKKWERCWEEVRHCSEKCRRNRGRGT